MIKNINLNNRIDDRIDDRINDRNSKFLIYKPIHNYIKISNFMSFFD